MVKDFCYSACCYDKVALCLCSKQKKDVKDLESIHDVLSEMHRLALMFRLP